MKESEIRKIVFGNTIFSVYACNENDEPVIDLFEKEVLSRLECVEEVYNWLRRHDIYYKVSYNKSFRHPFGGYISSRLNFERFKMLFPVTKKALEKFYSEDELLQDILDIFGGDDCVIKYYPEKNG